MELPALGKGELLVLDTATLVATVVVVLTVLSGLLAVAWLQNRGVAALGLWSVSFLLCAGAAALWSAREVLSEWIAIDAANALRLLAFGVGWQAARRFAGRAGDWRLATAPALLWLIAAWLQVLDGDVRARVVLTSLLIGAYALAIAAELWSGSRSGLRMARPAAIILAIHGCFFIGRGAAVLALSKPILSLDTGAGGPINPIVIFEAMIVALALAFILVSAAKEQLEVQHREASLIDPLTGISNRRGFGLAVGQMLARARREGSSTALLVLDLDHFKAVNDTWGHQLGDAVLQAVARAMEQELRGGDIMARLGGEEFAVALANSRADQAAVLAERIRRAVAALDFRRDEKSVVLSVSIGVSSLRAAESLDGLFALADAALYRAKAAGRNRVELATSASLPAIAPTSANERVAEARAA